MLEKGKYFKQNVTLFIGLVGFLPGFDFPFAREVSVGLDKVLSKTELAGLFVVAWNEAAES